jgi:predicted RNA-binding Zn-ribbon protein involved in translation (DUF1610 family)
MPRKVDKSKIKYTCPECGLNAWAKIGANLMCGDCEEGMIHEGRRCKNKMPAELLECS